MRRGNIISSAGLGLGRPHSSPSCSLCAPALECVEGHQPDFGFFRICLCTANKQKTLLHLFLTCWFALSLVLITYTDFAEVPGWLPQSFSWDYVVAVNDTKRTYKRHTNLLMPNSTKAQGPHLPPCQGARHCAVTQFFLTERLLPTQVSPNTFFTITKSQIIIWQLHIQVGVEVTVGNNVNQHWDNDLSLPQQTQHLSLPSPLLLKTSPQFL